MCRRFSSRGVLGRRARVQSEVEQASRRETLIGSSPFCNRLAEKRRSGLGSIKGSNFCRVLGGCSTRRAWIFNYLWLFRDEFRPALGAGGRRFKSYRPDQISNSESKARGTRAGRNPQAHRCGRMYARGRPPVHTPVHMVARSSVPEWHSGASGSQHCQAIPTGSELANSSVASGPVDRS